MNMLKHLQISNPESPLGDFKRIADILLNRSILRINDKTYRICSIEFYYQNNHHQDKAAHQHKRQLSTGEWYFHGSGLDITFGNQNEYGGILIQVLKEMEEPEEFIIGPLNVVTKLFENFGQVDKRENIFGLEEFNHNKEDIISAPRVGLNKITVGEDFSRGYRFLIFPREAHKNKKEIINHIVSTTKMTEKEAEAKIYKS